MSKDTPTTGNVMANYCYALSPNGTPDECKVNHETFFRWLYEQKADAFDQGAAEMREYYYSGDDVVNPYRKGENNE